MKRKTRNFFICFFLYQLITLGVSWFKQTYHSPLLNILWLFGVALILPTTYFFLILIREIFNDEKLEAEVHTLSQQQDLKDQQLRIIQKRQEETTRFQEDIRDKLLILCKQPESHEYEDAKRYFQEISENYQEIRFRPCCSDSLINAILDGKRQIAVEHHIQVNYQILLPEHCELYSSTLSSVFFNLLDNGIESCLRSENTDPVLSLQTQVCNDFLLLHMENSKSSQEAFSSGTSKQDAFSHGLGLWIIEEIVKKCDGTCKWQGKGEIFDSVVMIRISKLDVAGETSEFHISTFQTR